MAKPKKININSILKAFKEISNDDVKQLGLSLVEELKFMQTTMLSLKEEITNKGVVVSMPQGNYDIERSNPAIASYNTMVKNYNSTIKQIYELLNSNNINPVDDFDNDDLIR